MDTAVLVQELYAEGKKLIEALDEKMSVWPTAFLMKNDELDEWDLILGFPNLNITGSHSLYKKIHEVIIEKDLQLSLNDIKLLDTKDQLLKQLRTAIKTGKEIGRINFFGNSFKGQRFPDSIIYRVL